MSRAAIAHGVARSRGEPEVVATGLGVVSCLGLDLAGHWQRLMAGANGVQPLCGDVAAALPLRLHAPAIGVRVDERIRNRMLRKLLLPSGLFAVAAAGEAIADAGLAGDERRLDDCGLYFGTVDCELPGRTFEPALRASFDGGGCFDFGRFGTVGMEQVDPLLIVKGLPNAAPCAIAIEHGIRGANASYTSGHTSGLQAAVAGFDAIRRGVTDVALVGGSDSLLLTDQFIAHHLAGRLITGAERPWFGARPFDLRRTGYVLGEGAACVVLESAARARARAARVYGAVLAAGEVTSSARGRDDDGRALEHAVCTAMRGGGEELDVAFTTSVGTPADDLREARASRRLFGDRGIVRLTAATGALGLTGAASGAFALVHALQSIASCTIPPLTGCVELDPACDVAVVRTRETRPVSRAVVWATDGLRNVALTVASAR